MQRKVIGMTDKKKRFVWIVYLPKAANPAPQPEPGDIHLPHNIIVYGIVLTGQTNYPAESLTADDYYVQGDLTVDGRIIAGDESAEPEEGEIVVHRKLIVTGIILSGLD
jgi:hypothetical protein